MLDIVEVADGKDLGFADSAVTKAGNVLAVQLGTLEYAPTFGVDYKYFIDSTFRIQDESFRAYLVQRLTEHQIDVSQITRLVENLFTKNTFYVGNNQEQ